MSDAQHRPAVGADTPRPARARWAPEFPSVVIHTSVRERDQHRGYVAAKAGDADAALLLARDLISPAAFDELRAILGARARDPILLPISALEATGFNAIPNSMARQLSRQLGWSVSSGEIVQSNTVGHTRAKSFNRFVTPAAFEGPVGRGRQ